MDDLPSSFRISSALSYQFNCYQEEEDESPRPLPSSSHAIPASTLSLRTYTGSSQLSASGVHKMWTMIQLDACTNLSDLVTGIDFVIVIDHSASMRLSHKLAFVQATIEYLISKLTDAHRFCLIKFNQEVSMVTNGLLPMTLDNKIKARSLLHDIKPQGTTNISDALFTALGILSNRQDKSRISTIMLFTDGLSNAGLRGKTFMDTLKDLNIPTGLTIHTFGYGVDHDSKQLQGISFSSNGGVYHYIESVESIAATFGECLAGILSTVAHSVDVQLSAQDGCRIVNFYTKFPIKEVKSVKDYQISLGSMYSQESRSILFKLSLRKMDVPMRSHTLVTVTIRYINTLSGLEQKVSVPISIGRPSSCIEESIPVELDKQINRYTAAAAIEEAVKKAVLKDYNGAQRQLKEVIEIVQNSPSAKDPSAKEYCEDLVEDLKECALGMENNEVFTMGIHYAHAYSSMYYMERSTGSSNLKGVMEVRGERKSGYGYATYKQKEEASLALKETGMFVTAYIDNVL